MCRLRSSGASPEGRPRQERKMTVSRTRNRVAASGGALAIALASPAAAQVTPPAAPTAEATPAPDQVAPDIVVTGRPAGSGINTLEAGYSITTLSADELKL